MDNEYDLDGEEYETSGSGTPQSQHPKKQNLDDRNIIEKTGSNVKNTGTAIKKTGEGVEKVGQGMQKAGDAMEKAGKTTENVGKGVENTGKGVRDTGKAVKNAGTATKNAGTAADAAGTAINTAGAAADATGIGALVGVPLNVVGTAASVGGKAAQIGGTAEEVGGVVTEVGGTAAEIGGKGIKGIGKGTKTAGQGLKTSGQATEETGKKIKDTGEKVEKVGENIEATGKQVNKVVKATKKTFEVAKNSWKYVIAFVLIGLFLGISIFYNTTMSPITEQTEGFKNFKNGLTNLAEAFSNLYAGFGFRTNEQAFYKEMEKLYNKSNGTLDLPLIISAISYTETENSNTTNYESINDDDEDLYNEVSGEYESEKKYTKGQILRLRKLGKQMINKDKSDEDILVDYVLKQKEFDAYLNGITDEEAKTNKAKMIVYEIYERKKWYTQVYGEIFDTVDAENYSTTCNGGIDPTLANSEYIGLPVDVASNTNISFDGDYAFGIRNGENHNGVDINSSTTGSSEGDNVYAIADGEVITSTPEVSCNSRTDSDCTSTAGAWVRIKHSVAVDGKVYNFISVYMHLQSNSGQPAVGTKVEKGKIIGKIGNTGDSSGAHLHFEFRDDDGSTYGKAIDPTNLFVKCTTNSELVGDTPKENAWWYLLGLGYTKEGAAGIMGNWAIESGFKANNLENSCEKGQSYGTIYTDESITAAIDSGELSREKFIASEDVCTMYSGGRYGYGLAQWTATNRKAGLYDFWKQSGSSSIGNLKMQLDYYKQEVSSMTDLENYLKSATSPEDSASVFFKKYEIGTAGEIRKTKAREIYKELKDKQRPQSDSNISSNSSVASRIMEKAAAIKAQISTNGYTYSNSGTKSVPSYNIRVVDCSSYVSWVLYEAGIPGFNAGAQQSSSMFNANPWNFSVVSQNEAKAGDILVYKGHVEIYAGNNTCYNAGANSAIKVNGTTSCSWSSQTITKVLRVG